MKLSKIHMLAASLVFFGGVSGWIDAALPRTLLPELLENMLLYKTTNARFHSGHLFEHSIWVTRSTVNLLQSKWEKGIDRDKFLKLLVIAALLHDIGKAGDLEYAYFEKKDHPMRSFEYILGLKKYFINKDAVFDFQKLFEQLGLPDDDRKFVAIMAGMHHELGVVMRGPRYITRSGFGFVQIREHVLKKLDNFIRLSHYMGCCIGRNDDCYKQLVYCFSLLAAADVCGAQVVKHDKEIDTVINNIIGIDISEYANSHGNALAEGLNAYAFFDYAVTGFEARNALASCVSMSD